MIQVARYRQLECPEAIREQVIRLMKLEWPSTFRPGRPEWPSEAVELDPVSIVLMMETVVASHAAVLRAPIEHAGDRYLAFGVAAMVTAAEYRGNGFGRRVFAAATSYMIREHADIGVFTCDAPLRGFYERDGWSVSTSSPLIGGTSEKPFRSDELGKVTLLQLFSERARANRRAITSSPIHIELGEGMLW
jgi:aminoglycoside 2'-N-acetyltransferase I